MTTSESIEATEWGPIFTVPNIISFVRLLCVPVFVVLLFGYDRPYAAAWLLAAIGATDWVDGYIARRFNQVSELGKVLDPTADRIMLLVGVTSIAWVGAVPWWFAGLTLFREAFIALAVIALASLGADRLDVTWWGKTGAFLLMISYPFFLAGSADISWDGTATALGWIFGVPGLFFAYLSLAEYIPAGLAVLRDRNGGTAPTPSVNDNSAPKENGVT